MVRRALWAVLGIRELASRTAPKGSLAPMGPRGHSHVQKRRPRTLPHSQASMKRAREEAAAAPALHSPDYVGVYRTHDGHHWRAWVAFAGGLHSVGGR
jgi:hypothetical protein